MAKDPFGNPFATLSKNDRRELNTFFDDDDDGYEQVNGHDTQHDAHNNGAPSSNDDVGGNNYNSNGHYDEDYSHDEEEDDYEHGHGRRSRNKKRGRSNTNNQNLGDIAPNLFSTENASSFNGIWFIVVGSLMFFLIGYWGLSKKESDKSKAIEALANPNLDANSVPDVVSSESSADEVNVVDTILNSNIDNNEEEEEGYYGVDEEVGPSLTYDQPDTPSSKNNANTNMFNFNAQQSALFDPFHLQATKIKENNDWLGAPFVVSPPQLPSLTSNNKNDESVLSGNRLGYLQYPTISNGTLVFSTEGDLYLTRLPANIEMNTQQQQIPMTAMKLTTTVGNAIHPKLNPKFPHLLVYSATYSATREIYLMDLRLTGSLQGAPGTPGGPALRLTYTPGGIRSVVGWDHDGTSILYSAMSMDSKSLPDVRLFRLRLSWGNDGSVSADGIENDETIGDSKSAAKVVSAESEGSEKSADEEKDEKRSEDETTDNKKSVEDANDTTIEQKEKSKGTASYEDDDDDDDDGDDDDDDDDDDDYTISDSQNYVDKVAAPDKQPVKEASASSSNKKKTKNSDNKKGKDDANKRKLEKEERQRRHLAKLASAQAQRRRQRQMTGTKSSINSIIEPVPLAQATEGLYHSDGCIYFTRFKQSSSTKRYVGGTAESLWAYCENQFDDVAIPLTGDYNGTSKSPSIHSIDGEDVLFFMSDRAPAKSDNDTATFQWIASSMDLWAVPLPISAEGTLGTPTRLTNMACQFNGIDLSEYTIDPSTGGVILRIGADLHFISLESIQAKLSGEDSTGASSIQQLPIAVYSDFSNMQERLIPINIPHHITTLDAYATPYGTISTLLTARGQTFVAPVIPDTKGIPQTVYGGGGRNMPARRHKVAPGSGGGGLVRILSAKHIPQPTITSAPMDSGERLALVLATDPLSPTGEHAFYLVRTDAMASPAFGFAALYEYGDYVEDTGLPAPFIGGHLETGGSTREGGLGSVYADSIKVSPCGRRFAFTDTDGRIVVVTVPTTTPVETPKSEGKERGLEEVNMIILPPQNEIGQPLVGGSDTGLVWSPGGRYLAIEHSARNQFQVISIADLGSPENGSIQLGRIVQATVDRFNSFSPVWGHSKKDYVVELWASALDPTSSSSSAGSGATALLFLSDRDIKLTGHTSPWGTRAPSPSFDGTSCVHVLPLQSFEDALDQNAINQFIKAPYGGGGAREVAMQGSLELSALLELMQKEKSGAAAPNASVVETDYKQKNATNTTDEATNTTNQTTDISNSGSSTTTDTINPFVIDTEISFGKEKDEEYSFARSSYRIDHIPEGEYVEIVCQLADDPSLVLLNKAAKGFSLSLFALTDWPSDGTEEVPTPPGQILQYIEASSDGKYIIALLNNKMKLFSRKVKDAVAFFTDAELEKNIADVEGLHLNVWPNLEFRQMYSDAWRLLRDYFYDVELHQVPWDEVFERFLPLVDRCSKREELDDVLRQMIGELSALHSFVYGGEYPLPHHGDDLLDAINGVASLGATLQRSVEKRGYIVVDIPERDPDNHMIDGAPMYSPLSEQDLRLSGQSGLSPGDVIVAVNGENVLDVPDLHYLLRNTAGESVRLDVLRMQSTSRFRELQRIKRRLLQTNENEDDKEEGVVPEPLIVVPMSSDDSADVNYAAWEWKTREHAKILAADSGFTVGYAHIQSMSGASAMDSFVRGFYPDYDKDAMIIDVRNNRGGNIDSWLLDTLQRRAWMYWESRNSNITSGGLGWNEQFAFRGHLVVLINEHTSSDGEGFARGVSELGLGKLVGTRTWGGGIWLSSDNKLVDGGIASAPEVGTYNNNLGWGMGIEQMGVMPDIEVDNNPKSAFEGKDEQLERAMKVLKEWLKEEPIALPKSPGPHRDMSKKEDCSA